MKLLLIGDFHGVMPVVKEEFDFILCTGDLPLSDEIRDLIFSNWGSKKKIYELVSKSKYLSIYKKAFNSYDKILKWLNEHPTFLVYGNNDYPFNKIKGIKYFKPESLNVKLKRFINVHLLTTRIVNYQGIQIIGFSGYRSFNLKFPKKPLISVKQSNDRWVNRLNKVFNKLNNGFSIFLAHDVPRGVLDKINNPKSPLNGKSIGDEYFLKFIKKYQPNVMVCGHMHENQGLKRVGKTLVINAGYAHDGHYALLDTDSLKVTFH